MKSRVVALVLPVAVVIEGAVLVACWWAANLPQHSPATQVAISLEVAVDVAAYNSKVYYVIVESPAGDQVYRLPCFAGVTVRDAIEQIDEIPDIASKCFRVARPGSGAAAGAFSHWTMDWETVQCGGDDDGFHDCRLQNGDRIYIRDGSKFTNLESPFLPSLEVNCSAARRENPARARSAY